MAAQAWKIYNEAKKYIGNGTINLGSGNFRLALVTSASNFATLTLSVWNSITNEVTSVTNSYSSSGKALAGRAWTVGSSAKAYMLDFNDVVFTGSGNAISNIKAAIIYLSAASTASRKLLCYASLTSSQFTLASGNTLTIQFATTGVFQMV